METMERYTKGLANIFLMLGLFITAGLMFLTAFDVTGRSFGHSVPGAYQISEIMEVWIICLAWPVTELVKGHVEMDIVFTRLSRPTQHRIEIFTNLLTLGIFCLVIWQGITLVKRNFDMGELIPILQIPLYPFQVVISIAAAVNCLVLVVRLLGFFGYKSKGV